MNVTFILLTLLIGAALTLVAGKKMALSVAIVVSLVALGLTAFTICDFQNGTNVSYQSQWITRPNIVLALKADGLSLLMVALTTFLTPLILLTAVGRDFKNPHKLYALVLFMAFAMTGTFLAEDGFVYYIFWELALIPIFFITLLWGNDSWDVRKAAIIKFFIYTFAGSLFMLVAFLYMYQTSGSFLLENLKQINLTDDEQTWIFLAFFLAYAIKLPIFPFHTWQANTYEKAPAIGTMLLSGIMLKMGVYSILRWQIPLTPNVSERVLNTVIVLCIIGIIYASLIALKETNLKRILAYSSMAHVGLIAAGAYTYSQDGMQGAVMQMLAHGIVIVALFFLVEIIYTRYGSYEIKDLGGIRVQAVKFASFFLIFVFASIGLPGTFSFIGEFTLLYSLSQQQWIYAILGGTTIILGAYYMLKMFQNAVLGNTNRKTFADLNTTEFVVLLVLAIAVIFFGIYPKPISDLLFISI
nr:NADH-quinone oxidoreductase subunit M [uncultured Flavobacterium sp.]